MQDDTPFPSSFSVPHQRAVAGPDKTFHWALLIVAGGVLVVASVLRVEGDDRVVLPVVNQVIPGVCTYKSWFGICCPGCGLTRCFISLAHGELFAAWRFNPVGILFFLVAALQIPLRSWQLWRIRRGNSELRFQTLSTWVFWGLVAALLVQWVVRTFVLGIVA
jgi:hypothetical protein